MDSPSAACHCGYSAMACSKALNKIHTILVFVCCLAREGWLARARLAPAGKKRHLKTCGQGGPGEGPRPGRTTEGQFPRLSPEPSRSPRLFLTPPLRAAPPAARRRYLHSTDEETEARKGQALAEGRGALGGRVGSPRQALPSGRSRPRPVPERPGLRMSPASLRSARGLVQRGCVAGQGHTALRSGGPAPPGPPPGTQDRGPGSPRAHLAHLAAPRRIAPAGPEPGRAAAHRRRPSSQHPGAGSAPPPWNSDPARKGRGRALKGAAPFSTLRPRGGRRRLLDDLSLLICHLLSPGSPEEEFGLF